jgi:hypothetical protein
MESKPIDGEKTIEEHLNKIDIDFNKLKLLYPSYFKNGIES